MEQTVVGDTNSKSIWLKVLKCIVGFPLTILSLLAVWSSLVIFSLEILGSRGFNGPSMPDVITFVQFGILYAGSTLILFFCAALIGCKRTPNPFKKAGGVVLSITILVILCCVMMFVALGTSGGAVATILFFPPMMIAPIVQIFSPQWSNMEHTKLFLKVVMSCFLLWAFFLHAELAWGWGVFA